MIKLVIKQADGSVYWTEHFNLLSDLNKWLNEERNRPYWKQDFTTEMTDLTPPPPTQAELDAIAALASQKQALKSRIKTLSSQADLTTADIKEAIFKLIKLMAIKNDLD
jgi:hypothetical protein